MTIMSREILIRELQQKSSERIGEIWREAEEKEKELRAEEERIFALYRSAEEGRLQEVERSAAAPVVFAAEKQAMQMIDDALRQLSDRLYALACKMLPQVRRDGYRDIFAGLVGELPPFEWETIAVNELDAELAGSYFPDAEIRTDPTISGGFTAAGDNDRYRVINTLDRRLEKAWPFVLPGLLREIAGEEDAAPAA